MCKWCGRDDFISQRGLTHHLERSRICYASAQAASSPDLGAINTKVPLNRHNKGDAIRAKSFHNRCIINDPKSLLKSHDLDDAACVIGAYFDDDIEDQTAESSDKEASDSGQNQSETIEEHNLVNKGPDTWIRDQFNGYVNRITGHFLAFNQAEKASIQLMHTLRLNGAPLDAYNKIMMWHLKTAGLAHEYETGAENRHFISKDRLIGKLTDRYNMKDKFPHRKGVRLPVSRSCVQITLHDTKAVIQRLLTEPRNKPSDFTFFGDNPKAPPPHDLDYVSNLNTGQAFIKTHALLCTKEGDQALGLILYVDGASTSHFHDNELVAVKIALSILTKEARKKEYNWASIGYVEKVPESDGRSRNMAKLANHLEEQDAVTSEDDSDLMEKRAGVGDKNVQDWHAMVSVIIADLVDLCDTGFMWDHPFKGQSYENIHYKVFIPFIRCDNKEADTMCGRYQQRSTTNQICRYCHVLTRKADQHCTVIKFKTKTEIQKLVQKEDLPKLKALSQNHLINAFYSLRFSSANDRSIHGACPADMLHTILLGLLRYTRLIFYEMVGPTSEKSKLIDALAKIYCREFTRQSDRSLPNTNFSKGIRGGGKLMAKECRGIILVMLAVFRSSKGRELLEHRSKHFQNDAHKDDWILLLETLLEWEAYLNSEVMLIRHVKRLEKKHRYILYLMRKVANRKGGMGLKLLKFHVVLHLFDDILNFGVPQEFDTSANEGHHRTGKRAAELTQKEASNFQCQTAVRMTEFHLLELAMAEIEGGIRLWNYFTVDYPIEPLNEGQNLVDIPNLAAPVPESVAKIDVQTGETGIEVWRDDATGETMYKLLSRSKFKLQTRWPPSMLTFWLNYKKKWSYRGQAC